jgi:hypothetical protein
MSWKFWKKEESLPDFGSSYGKTDFGLKDPTALDLSDHFQPSALPPAPAFSPTQPPMPSSFSQPSFNPQPSFAPQSFTPPGAPAQEESPHIAKELEIIAAKLDTIRAQLEMLNSRVANLERDQGPPKRPWY